MRKVYWEIITDISKEKEWFSNWDYSIKTHGSPKFTSRVSDMKKKGVEFADRWVDNKEIGRHKEYKLLTSEEDVKKLMK